MTDTNYPTLQLNVFLPDARLADRFLLEQLAPIVLAWSAAARLRHWYFMRPGHRRDQLCLYLDGAIAAQSDLVRSVLRGPDARYEVSQDSDHQAEPLRFGGPAALAASERLSCESSTIALDIIRTTADDMAGRVSMAFALMAAAIFATGTSVEAMAEFFRHFAAFSSADQEAPATTGPAASAPVQASYVNSALRLSDHADTVAVARWAGAVGVLLTALAELYEAGCLLSPWDGKPVADAHRYGKTVQAILGAHIRMLNNRLDIAPALEQVLANSLCRAARQAAHHRPGQRAWRAAFH